MDRIVREINERGEVSEQARRFSEFADQANIVLLGDPGSGKSHTFRECAAGSGGRLIGARAFLVIPPVARDEPLFIDALDEKRASRTDRDTVDELVKRLFEVRPPKVRISCRAADWLGPSDLSAFRHYFGPNGGDPAVLLLDRLSKAEQLAILTERGRSTADVHRPSSTRI